LKSLARYADESESRGDVFRDQLNLIRVRGRAQERGGGKNVAGSAIIQPWLTSVRIVDW